VKSKIKTKKGIKWIEKINIEVRQSMYN
jgi:hypothetical protein